MVSFYDVLDVLPRAHSWYFNVFFRARIRSVPLSCSLRVDLTFRRQNDPQHLSGFVRRVLYQFIGPN